MCIVNVHVCVYRCTRDGKTERVGQTDKKYEGTTDREGETFSPYEPQIVGQLVAEYLKDTVYLTCGRQLLTLCCTATNTQKGKHTADIHLHVYTCARSTHTL